MSEEQIINKRPTVTVGAYVVNKKGEILMMRSPKWGNRLLGPGGHIEYREMAEDAVKREVKEETGLDISDVELLTSVEVVLSEEFTAGKKHFICLDHKAKLIDENQEIILNGREGSEYMWLKPEDIMKRNDVESTTKGVVEKYFLKEKHGIFSKKCKDCEKNKKECDEYKSGWQRALADYKNLQAEVERRRGEWAKMSEAQILEEFIPVYDNFKKAFAVSGSLPLPEGEIKRGWESWAQGIEYIKKQFADILKNHGVEEIKTVGEKFDPNLHESVGDEEVEGKEHGEILKEVDGGYIVNGKVLRVAKVIIAQ